MSKGGDAVAYVYADALLALAFEKGIPGEVKRDLEEVARVLAQDPLARTFLTTPHIRKAAKREVVERAFGGRVTEVVQNFLKVVVDKGRGEELPAIIAAFLAGYHKRQGELVATVRSAQPLDDDERDRLRAAIKKRFQKAGINEVILEEKVDASLLGGLIVRTGDDVHDGSLRTRLQALGDRLKASRQLGEELYED